MTKTTTARLRQAAAQVRGPVGAGALYVWLHVNHDAVQDARAKGCGWMKIAEIAIEDGALSSATDADLKRLRRKWQRVCAARAKEELRRSEAAAQREARRAAAAGKPIMPSRLSPKWRPPFVEPRKAGGDDAPRPVGAVPRHTQADGASSGSETGKRSRAEEAIERMREQLRREERAKYAYFEGR